MALTAAQIISTYQACGLSASGGTRYRYKFNAYSMTDIAEMSLTWSYATVKTTLDTRLAALTADEVTWLGTHIATWDATVTSSFSKTSGPDGVILNDEDEHRKATRLIVSLVGIEVEPVDFGDGAGSGINGGRVVR